MRRFEREGCVVSTHPPSPAKTRAPGVNRFSARKDACLRGIEEFFLFAGGFIFDHALWFICASILIVFVCSLSFLFIHFETRADLLYALPSSQARSDLAKLATLFGSPPRVNMVFVVSAFNHSILTPTVLRKVRHLDDYIKHNLVSTPSSRSRDPAAFSYDDVCHRMVLPDVNFSAVAPSPLESAETAAIPDCYSMGPLDLYRNEKQYGTPLATRSWPYIPNVAANKIIKADLTLTDPNIVKLPSGTTRLYNATGFLFLYHTASDTPEKLRKSLEWEKALVDFVNHRIKPYAYRAKYTKIDKTLNLDAIDRKYDEFHDSDWYDYQVFVNAQRSWQDELGRSTSFDKRLMRDYCIAYLIIATYMILANRTNNLVRSKAFCGFIGSLSALFGFAFGGGICYWLGLRHTPTMHASPFLVLGIGLDNTFVVLNFYTLAHPYTKTPRQRCRMALCEAGLSITNTTFTSIISFLVGAAGPYLAVRNFCLITAMGLFGGYLMNIIFAFPFLCLEAVAESEGRISFLPWPVWVYKLLPNFLMPAEARTWIRKQEQAAEEKAAPPPVTSVRMGDPFNPRTMHSSDPATSTGQQAAMSVTVPTATKSQATPSTSPRTHSLALTQPPAGWGPTTVPLANHQQQSTAGATGRSRLWHTHQERHTIDLAGDVAGDDSADSDVFEDPPSQALLEHQVTAESAETVVSLTSPDSTHALKGFIRERFFTGERTIQELASIQWAFAKKNTEFANTLRQRRLGVSHADDASALSHDFESGASSMSTETPSLLEGDVKSMSTSTLEKYSQLTRVCCEAIEEPDGNVGQASRKVFLNYLGPAITRRWMQALVMTVMLTYIGVSIFGALMYLTAGLNLENLTPPDSYLREAFYLSRDKFPIFPYETNVVFTAPKRLPMDSENVDERKDILKAFNSNKYGTRNPNAVAALTHSDDDSAHVGIGGDVPAHESARYWGALGEIPWWDPDTYDALQAVDTQLRQMMNTQDVLNGMMLFFNENANKIFIPDSTSEERRTIFYKELYRWLRSGVVGQHVRNQFRFADPDPEDPSGMPRLLGYRMVCFNFNFLNSFEQSQYMVNVRNECKDLTMDWESVILDESEMELEGLGITDGIPHLDKKAPMPVYRQHAMDTPEHGNSWFTVTPFMETFIYFESDVSILRSTIINMATAFVAIVLVSSMLMRGFGTAVLVTLMICFVDLGIFGFMGFWSIHLNILSMILLVLSIGFSVDYTVHVVHTFTHCPGRLRKDKTVETLILMCNPVTHGALSTMLGICPIGFRNEFIMETFFKMTILVVSFGFINGVVFLPVILAIKGPRIPKTEQRGVNLRKYLNSVIQPLANQVVNPSRITPTNTGDGHSSEELAVRIPSPKIMVPQSITS
eukprot:Gregarina_sp_Pseudo_9__5823@NODE_88_length_4393_cov_8_233578_g80_i0_p1_GENE_NODE_88_length_4393_cov_8_233578_g80_i0NODE_88_length_4393_cov_8_233578_g80_i0_p1_ORF_typecomplete_len1374_score274_55Patched/PF02460_18/1_6e100Sterolsensing/PF12349_8/2_9e03Sterolsensing/PF12349_8/5_1e23Sterolsensing/PF12349_8/3MMPL/PF03176_15/5_2e03MMPL/PF03176_15/1_4e07MMPL/PF03176_15/1_7e03MMPL/PF03176_15/4_9e09ACR_tran/PF00873_19/17ACR_tran/PF00873_19/9_8e10SecD_SecF/PF02355_16/6e05SecD_SecF/PF02355_16/2_4e03SecD_Se